MLGNILYVNKAHDAAMQQHHERIIHVGTEQDHAFWYITRSYERLRLGIGTKQERIPFWKWERAVHSEHLNCSFLFGNGKEQFKCSECI